MEKRVALWKKMWDKIKSDNLKVSEHIAQSIHFPHSNVRNFLKTPIEPPPIFSLKEAAQKIGLSTPQTYKLMKDLKIGYRVFTREGNLRIAVYNFLTPGCVEIIRRHKAIHTVGRKPRAYVAPPMKYNEEYIRQATMIYLRTLNMSRVAILAKELDTTIETMEHFLDRGPLVLPFYLIRDLCTMFDITPVTVHDLAIKTHTGHKIHSGRPMLFDDEEVAKIIQHRKNHPPGS